MDDQSIDGREEPPTPTSPAAGIDETAASLSEEQAREVVTDYLRSVGKRIDHWHARRDPGCWVFQLGGIPRGPILVVTDSGTLTLSSCRISRTLRVGTDVRNTPSAQ